MMMHGQKDIKLRWSLLRNS